MEIDRGNEKKRKAKRRKKEERRAAQQEILEQKGVRKVYTCIKES